jgi:hypothetical protein
MNNLVKTAVAGALALGATSAFALSNPNTNTSDLVLIVEAFSGTSGVATYALDTGISINTIMPGAQAGTNLGPTTANANSTTYAGISKTISSSSTLNSFLTKYAGDSFQWTVEGGEYPGNGGTTNANASNTQNPGNGIAVFTSQLQKPPTTEANGKMTSFLNGLSGDLSTGGLSSLTGTETSTATQSTAANTKYGFYGASDLSPSGSSPVTIWGFTGNGVNDGNLESYILGNATFTVNATNNTASLSFAANQSAPVPLPAAVWLLGSGVLGLVGVSRRRKTAV